MDKYIIPNLRNACRILKWMREHPAGHTLQDISENLKIPRTTTLRILKTLQAEHLIREENRNYNLGASLISLGMGARAGIEIRNIALPHLKHLTDQSGETCHLAIPMEGRSMIIEVNLSAHPLRATSRAGAIVDLNCSATGKVFMAYVYFDRLKDLVPREGFVKKTPNTLTTFEELEKEAILIRKQGYSIDEEEFFTGVRCMAVPVSDSENQVVAAVGMTASVQRFPRSKIRKICRLLQEASLSIAQELGSK